MNPRLEASIYLKGVLPLMGELVQDDRQAADAIAGQRLVIQFEVKHGPVVHLDPCEGRILHGTGPHPDPDFRLTFKTPDLLTRLLAGEEVRPGIRKGFTRLNLLTTRFPIQSNSAEGVDRARSGRGCVSANQKGVS